MKSLTTILILSMIFLFSFSTHAQFDLGKKIKKKIDKELDKAADDAIDETAETIIKGGEKKNENDDQTETKKDKDSDKKTEKNTSVKISEGITSNQSSFEGKVVFQVKEGGEQQVMEYFAKDKKFKMDMPDKGGSIIFDSQKFKMYVIMDEQKMYMETMMMPMSTGTGGGSITKTGETKSILDYDCEKFLFTQKDMKGEAWMTKELGAFMFFMESQEEMPGWQTEVLDAGYFPLHVKQHDTKRNVTSVYEVTEVTPMNLSDGLFELPSSYKKFDLMNLGGFENLIEK
jgi:hypothetical protein